MNPELQRNLWLELGPMRLIMMPAVLGLIFAAVWTGWDFGSSDPLGAVAGVASALYFFIVVIWGTWIAARLVTGEIRDRTWDGQRMSAIGPWSMVMGKLLGGTAFVWYGGLICLIPIILNAATAEIGQGTGLISEILFRLGMGLFAHATAFLISMFAVRRKAASSRLASFFAMVAGIFAAAWVWYVWVLGFDLSNNVDFSWFTIHTTMPTFTVISLLIFAAWAIVGNWVMMRQELQINTGPLIWIGFLVFAMVYYAGQADFFGIFDELRDAAIDTAPQTPKGPEGTPLPADGLPSVDGVPADILATIRWLIAFGVAYTLTYLSVLIAPKDWVQLRQVRGHLLRGRIPQALWILPSWIYAAIAAAIAGVVLALQLDPITASAGDLWRVLDIRTDFVPSAIDLRPTIFAALAFLCRDVLIVLWFNAAKRARRPDLAAFVVLWVLYNALPALFMGMGALKAMGWFSPWPVAGAGWLQVLWPSLQVALMLVLVAIRRSAVREK